MLKSYWNGITSVIWIIVKVRQWLLLLLVYDKAIQWQKRVWCKKFVLISIHLYTIRALPGWTNQDCKWATDTVGAAEANAHRLAEILHLNINWSALGFRCLPFLDPQFVPLQEIQRNTS